MASAIAKDLRSKSDAALTELTKQLQGMEPFMERPDASGAWTTREVLSHLLGAPGGAAPLSTGACGEEARPLKYLSSRTMALHVREKR